MSVKFTGPYGGSDLFLEVWATLPCQCNYMPQCCVCPVAEKVMRAYSCEGSETKLPLMNPDQRAWCIEESDSAGEGNYDRVWLSGLSDRELARTVLQAWKEYVDDHF